MNKPGMGGTGGSAYDRACDYFRRLPESGKMELRYRAAKDIPGFEVLLAEPSAAVLSVWKRGADIRLLIAGSGRNSQPVDATGPRWVAFSEGKASAPAGSPAEFLPLDLRQGLPPKMEIEEQRHASPWALTVGGNTYRIGTWSGKRGLWKLARGRDPVLVIEGNCANPVITPDGRWAVVAKADGTWAQPHSVYRVDLASGKIGKLDIPAADRFYPVAYVPSHGKVLLLRASASEPYDGRKQVGPEGPQYRLLDAASGASEIVTGELAPLESQSIRPLQPTGKPHQVWAAGFNSGTGSNEIGSYDTLAFGFHPALSVPLMRFDSVQMWVDEAEAKIYVAYDGHLLRMVLPAQ